MKRSSALVSVLQYKSFKHSFSLLPTESAPTAPRTLAGIRSLHQPPIKWRVRLGRRRSRLTGWFAALTSVRPACQSVALFSRFDGCRLTCWVRRPTLGGLLGSSYRQHQESLAAERERRRLEREERLQRIEREERNRFKLVSLLLITPTKEKNKLSDSTSEQMYYVFLLDCRLLHSPKNRLAGMRFFFLRSRCLQS